MNNQQSFQALSFGRETGLSQLFLKISEAVTRGSCLLRFKLGVPCLPKSGLTSQGLPGGRQNIHGRSFLCFSFVGSASCHFPRLLLQMYVPGITADGMFTTLQPAPPKDSFLAFRHLHMTARRKGIGGGERGGCG